MWRRRLPYIQNVGELDCHVESNKVRSSQVKSNVCVAWRQTTVQCGAVCYDTQGLLYSNSCSIETMNAQKKMRPPAYNGVH